MKWLGALLGRRDEGALALYATVVRAAREPHWYLDGRVPDTVDGRFDMVAAVLAMVLLRLEAEAEGAPIAVQLTERFIEDMDSQVRELGFGDVVVGKQVGRMMSMLGGRLGAYRDGLADGTLDAALVRNLYRGETPGTAAVAHVRDALIAWHRRAAETTLAMLAEGTVA